MRCVNCDGELIPGKRFCPTCGAQVALKCPSCGAIVEEGYRFCPDCGVRLASEALDAAGPPATPAQGSPASRAPSAPVAPRNAPPAALDERLARLARQMPEGLAEKIRASGTAPAEERKLVTVLFCDLVGSTAIAARLDPEEYRDLLEQYLAITFREIYKFEGIVNQLAGDGLMALFGAPVAHEDAPERAVRASLAIRVALDEFNRRPRTERGLALQVRIGIHTGPVVVGTVGNDLKMDYTAIGDTTNLASRLQSLARPGTILVSEATGRLVRGRFRMQAAGPFEVKGKAGPIVAHEVLGAIDAATPMAIAEARGLTPLVGRSAELAQLTTCYERLGENLAQVVAVIGDAGSGKSRLIYEFKQRLAGEPAALFEARCSALSQSVPYAPWIGMLRQYFDITPGEDVGCACDKVARRVRGLDPTLDTLYPFLCRLLSVPVEGQLSLPEDELKQQTFEAVATLVNGTSQQNPVVMIIEDLHWIDEASREMLELAVRHVHSTRIMLIVSHRPDYQPAWRAHAAFTQLSVRPLANDEATAVIRAAAGGRLPVALERRILAKAEGNPFFLEEITRALIEEGSLLRGDGRIRLTRAVAEIGIPDTVQEVIGARLDRLGPHAKRVAQVAAVLGRQFHHAHLVELLASEGIDVARELERLEERGVVHRKHALSKDEYRFGESLAQDVAYETLLLKERRQLHERIGLLLESTRDESDAERDALLAHHFARSDNRERAIAALLRAAHRAEQLPSYITAAKLFRQAWELADAALDSAGAGAGEHLQRSAIEAAVGLARAVVLYGPLHLSDAERAARRGRELAEALGDVESLAGLCLFLGMIMMSSERDKFAEGLALAEEGLVIAQRAHLAPQAVSISRGLAWGYLNDGQFALAQRTIAWVMAELEQHGHRERLSDIYFGARWIQDSVRFHSDDLEGALAGATETHALALGIGNRTSRSGAAANLARVHLERGNYPEALRWAEQSLEIAQAIGSVAAIQTASAIAMLARTALGESGFAARYVDLIDEVLASGGTLPLSGRIVVEAFLAIGDLKRARRIADLAYGRGGGRLREAIIAGTLGDVMLRLGAAHWSDAERWYAQALASAQTLGARSTEVAALLGTAELAVARGDREAAVRQLHPALAICRDLGFDRAQARGERLLAESRASAQQLA